MTNSFSVCMGVRPEFAELLVECGIDSLSVTPDSFIAMKRCGFRCGVAHDDFLVHSEPSTLRAMDARLAQDRISAEVILLPSLDDP